MLSYDERVALIQKAAVKYGIDPKVALKVARSEGLKKGVYQSVLHGGMYGKREPSYGVFQMLVGGGQTGFKKGLGNQFKEQTGKDPRDPANEPAMIDFAMKHASNYGWGDWSGARKLGYTGKRLYEGINKTGSRPTAVADTTSDTTPDQSTDVPTDDSEIAPAEQQDYPDMPESVDQTEDVPAPEEPSKLGAASKQLVSLGTSMMDKANQPFDYTPAGDNQMDVSAPPDSGIPVNAYSAYMTEPQMVEPQAYAEDGGSIEEQSADDTSQADDEELQMFLANGGEIDGYDNSNATYDDSNASYGDSGGDYTDTSNDFVADPGQFTDDESDPGIDPNEFFGSVGSG